MQTINGFLWYVEAENEDYYYFTPDETCPELPEGHYATFYGGGLINAEVVKNAVVDRSRKNFTAVCVFVPDRAKQIEALLRVAETPTLS